MLFEIVHVVLSCKYIAMPDFGQISTLKLLQHFFRMSKVRNTLLNVQPLQHSDIIELGKTISPGQDVHCLLSSVPSFTAEKGLFKVVQDDYDT